ILYQEVAIIKLTEFIQKKDASMNKQGFINKFSHDTNLWKYQYKRKRIDTVCYYFLCSPPLSSCSTMAYYHLTSDDEEVPDDYDKPFCPSFEKAVDNDQLMFFRIFITIKRLISNADKTKHLTVDATYKLIWQGFPVLMIGTTDRQKHFHPFGICISTNETGDDFRFLFESLKKVVFDVMQLQYSSQIKHSLIFLKRERVMCIAHVIRKVDAQLNRFTTEAQKAIKYSTRQDIMRLQLCESEEIFDAVLKLFINKWRSYKSELIDNFLDYFCCEWTTRSKGWFEGYAPGVPSTNNALESWNLIIKLESTMRQRHNLSSFLTILENDIIGRWSRDRHPENVNRAIFYTEFNCDLQLYTAAFQWTSNIKTDCFIKISSSNGRIFYSHQDLNLKLTKETVDDYILTKQNLSWRKFNDYSQFCQINETILCSDDWKQSKCNCREFAKHYICIHVLGLAYSYKLCIIPEKAKTNSIGQKRKRGRPKKQKAALFYQNDCDLNSSENEEIQEPPSDSVIEKESVTEATVEATVDLPRKRGRPKKSTTQGKKTKIN
ncbi:hypothetical protein BpHYR1_040067, partial [Brachionus plicatilis]